MRRLSTFLAATILLLGMAAAQAGAVEVFGTFNPGTDHTLPNNGRPLHSVDFPAISDWRTLRITLSRTMCFGTCPAYSVEIDGDGTVIFTGQQFVAATGLHRAHIAPQRVRALFEAFHKAQFFWLLDRYRSAVTDMPLQTVSLSYDGHGKTVEDYAGVLIGMPRAVMELENLIDAAANTARWIKPARHTPRATP